ncbi:hypothetical protein [Paraburkholderia sp. 2C]
MVNSVEVFIARPPFQSQRSNLRKRYAISAPTRRLAWHGRAPQRNAVMLILDGKFFKRLGVAQTRVGIRLAARRPDECENVSEAKQRGAGEKRDGGHSRRFWRLLWRSKTGLEG